MVPIQEEVYEPTHIFHSQISHSVWQSIIGHPPSLAHSYSRRHSGYASIPLQPEQYCLSQHASPEHSATT